MQADLVGILESIYRLEQDTPSWIGGILERLSPWVDVGLGLFGFIYSVSPAGELRQDSFASRGCTPGMVRELPFALAQLEPEYIRRGYLTLDATAASEIPGWRESGSAAYAKRQGVLDSWGILGRNRGNRGCAIVINRPVESTMPPRQRELFTRIAAHLAAAQRLRDRLRFMEAVERAEAVIAPDGKVQHATRAAKGAKSLDALRSGTLAIEQARGQLREDDPECALGIWKGLVVARWTLVDHFERDGRRFVLAQENEPEASSRTALSPREHQVLANAALGRSNKEIAYALGISHSTVRVLLARAAKKLGAHTRAELIRRFEALSTADQDPAETPSA